MCEKCVAQKRAARAAMFAPPADVTAGDVVAAIPGYLEFVSLARQIEDASLHAAESPETVPMLGEAIVATMRSWSSEQRGDAYRVARAIASLASVTAEQLGVTMVRMQDQNITSVAVTLEERTIVVRINGAEVSRVELQPEQDAGEALDAAERAMQAHRTQYHGGEG